MGHLVEAVRRRYRSDAQGLEQRRIARLRYHGDLPPESYRNGVRGVLYAARSQAQPPPLDSALEARLRDIRGG
jgi:hypothetical protein